MFDIGFSEFFLIFLILLIVVGPKRLPGLAKTAGHWIGKARSMVSAVRTEIEQELKVEELKQSIQEQVPMDEFKALANDMSSLDAQVKKEAGNIDREVHSAIDDSTKNSSVMNTATNTTDASGIPVSSTTATDNTDDVDNIDPVSTSTKTSAAKAPVE